MNIVFWIYSPSSVLQIAIFFHPPCSFLPIFYWLHLCRFFTSPFFSFTLPDIHTQCFYAVLIHMFYTCFLHTTAQSLSLDIYFQHFFIFTFFNHKKKGHFNLTILMLNFQSFMLYVYLVFE